MEFPFLISSALDIAPDGFATISTPDFDQIHQSSKNESTLSSMSSNPQKHSKDNLTKLLDTLGKSSAKAQELKHLVTSYNKFMSSIANKIYIKADAQTIYGYLRIEIKKLSFQDLKGVKRESKFLCLIDFYVPESHQRIGIGKTIFQKMLDTEQTQTSKLAYRRPSLEMFSFLKRYYGLTDHITQNTGHIIFKAYLESLPLYIQRPSANQLTSHSIEDIDKKKRDSVRSNVNSEGRPEHDHHHHHRLSKFGLDAEDISKKLIRKRMNIMDTEISRQESNLDMDKSKVNSGKHSDSSDGVDSADNSFEEPKPSGEELIDALLKAPSLLDNNIFKKSRRYPVNIKGKNFFENEGPRKFYEQMYKWSFSLKAELKKESNNFEDKLSGKRLPGLEDELEFSNKIALLQKVFGIQENGNIF